MPTKHSTRHPEMSDSHVGSLTINAAFFEEVKEAHAEVCATKQQILQLGKGPQLTEASCRELIDLLEQLFELIGLYFSLEETYGYFEDPVFVGAAYSKRVSDLRAEHSSLWSELGRICDHASRLHYNGRLHGSADTILARFRVFCDQLEQHEMRERVLISEAFTIDIGCAD